MDRMVAVLACRDLIPACQASPLISGIVVTISSVCSVVCCGSSGSCGVIVSGSRPRRSPVSVADAFVAILVVANRLVAHGSVVCAIRVSHISWGTVRWKGIGVVMLFVSSHAYSSGTQSRVTLAVAGRAGSIVVCGRGAECLFSLVVAQECHFDEGREEEESTIFEVRSE